MNRDFDSVNTIDVIAFLFLTLGGAVISGLAVIIVAGYDLNTTVYTLGTATAITAGMVLPAAGLGLAVSTNEFDRDEYVQMSRGEQAAIGTVVVGLAAVIFAPDVAALVQENLYAQIAYTGAHGGAGLVIASE